jgi:hypothetical protein
VVTDANGVIPDIVTCNALMIDTRTDIREAREQVDLQIDNPTECVTQQTLIIAAPGYGLLGTATYQRTYSNLDAEGNRRPSRDPLTGRRVDNFRTTLGPVTHTYPNRNAP